MEKFLSLAKREMLHKIISLEEWATSLKASLVPIAEINKVVHQNKDDILLLINFGGHMLSCCDEGIMVTHREKLFGMSSIAPYSREWFREAVDCKEKYIAEIKGMYVFDPCKFMYFCCFSEAERFIKSIIIGKLLLEESMKRCMERGLRMPVLYETFQKRDYFSISLLPEELKSCLKLIPFGDCEFLSRE